MRNTLHVSAVPILKKETHLPVVVDITYSTGRCDPLLPAQIQAQRMNIPQFNELMNELKVFGTAASYCIATFIVDFCW